MEGRNTENYLRKFKAALSRTNSKLSENEYNANFNKSKVLFLISFNQGKLNIYCISF